MAKTVKYSLAVLLCLMLTVSLCAPTPSASAASSNLDSASSWARADIAEALEKKFVPWDIQYNYTAVITRLEFCSMAVKFLEYATGRSVDEILLEKGLVRDAEAFTDTSNSDILAAFALGITNGTGNRQFTPDGQFSREQAASMMRNVCMVIGADVSSVPDAGYVDIGSVSDWAVPSVNYCFANKLMIGTNTAPLTFSPKDTYTREQSIVAFNNFDGTGILEEAGIFIVPTVSDTQARAVSNWANVSDVQQFAYLDEGLAYAYLSDGSLIITTPSKSLDIRMRYPLLGDVIADEDGNFYVVWGKPDDTNNKSAETMFISKYLPGGEHVKTIGFVIDTQVPFSAGNCVSAIGDGSLMVSFARRMYSGHQANGVIGVNLSDMSPIKGGPYTSHSFNQSLIWSVLSDGFIFADHGDAYDRGFMINDNMRLFHFYMESNANYNMYIVNKTFAQLGGLAETSRGIALVGASAMSISEAAKTEMQNLFVQIFDPLATEVSESMFVGGSTRSGATSFNINDNSNEPLTQVTDYGVHWLTAYSDTHVVAPQVVTAEDWLVILWSAGNDSFYMVLDADGTIIQPETSLKGMPLNSYERPVYYNGSVFWAAVKNERLTVSSFELFK